MALFVRRILIPLVWLPAVLAGGVMLLVCAGSAGATSDCPQVDSR
jgi:hypothetical protein